MVAIALILLVLTVAHTIDGDNLVDLTIGDDEFTVENFLQYGVKNGSKVESLRLSGTVGIMTAEMLKNFPRLTSIEILFWNNAYLIQPDIFRYNNNLTTINVRFGYLNDGDFLQLNHLRKLKSLELRDVACSAAYSKKFLDLPALTELIVSAANVTLADDVFEKMPNLDSIRIEGCNSKRLPSSLAKLSHVRKLYFRESSINKIRGDDLAQPSRTLELLDMSFGQLTEIAFPNSLPNLQTLILTANQLTSLPKNQFDATPSLSELKLTRNKLTRFPTSSVSRLNQLTLLDLSENYLDEFDLSYDKGQQQQLRTLDLSNNNLKLVHVPKMNGELRLNDNQLSRIRRNTFSPGSNFEIFDLSSNPITEIDSGALGNIVLPSVVNINNISVTTFSLDWFNNTGGLQSLSLFNCPSLQQVTASRGTKLPASLLSVVLKHNDDLSFDDSNGYLKRLTSSRNRPLFILGGSFVCNCQLKPLFNGNKNFVQMEFESDEFSCSNARNLTVRAFLAGDNKYCNRGKFTKAFPG